MTAQPQLPSPAPGQCSGLGEHFSPALMSERKDFFPLIYLRSCTAPFPLGKKPIPSFHDAPHYSDAFWQETVNQAEHTPVHSHNHAAQKASFQRPGKRFSLLFLPSPSSRRLQPSGPSQHFTELTRLPGCC